MSGHTPGPWIVVGVTRVIRQGNEGEAASICIVCDPEAGRFISEMKEAEYNTKRLHEAGDNARLIAAAPDLLECLKGFVLNVRQLNDEHFEGVQERLVGMAQAAIAKAEGAVGGAPTK